MIVNVILRLKGLNMLFLIIFRRVTAFPPSLWGNRSTRDVTLGWHEHCAQTDGAGDPPRCRAILALAQLTTNSIKGWCWIVLRDAHFNLTYNVDALVGRIAL